MYEASLHIFSGVILLVKLQLNFDLPWLEGISKKKKKKKKTSCCPVPESNSS